MDHHIGAAVRGRFNQILRWHHRQIADFRQTLNRQMLIAFRRIEAGADGGRAQVHFQQQFSSAQNAFGLFIQQHAEGVKLLTEGHWHGILQLGTAHFQDSLEFIGFVLEAFGQLADAIKQLQQ